MSRDLAGFADPRFGRLIESSAIATNLVGPDGRFRVVNPAMCEFLGYDAATLTTMTWADVTAPEYLPESIQTVEDIMAGRKDSCRITKQYLHADGRRVWGELTLSPMRNADGTVDELIAQILDITEQVELRARQEESDARFRKLMEISNVAIALIAPDGKMEIVNQALCDLFGYDEATLKTKTWQELTPARFREVDLEKVEDLVSGRLDTYRVVKQQIHADGHLFWVDVSVSCLRDSTGAVQYLFAQGIDITAEVESRELLAQREAENRILAEQLQAEVRNAAEYVKSVLPGDLPGVVEVSSRYLPSLDLGGDVFHYRWLDDDHLAVYLIDVSGHGIRPALLSMSVHNLIRSGSLPTAILLNPDRLLGKLNDLFQMHDQADSYFTVWYGVYQRSSRTLRYASAGHPPALVLNHDGGAVTTTGLSTRANPIGMFPDSVYPCDSYRVPTGCQVLLYSDGAFELPAKSPAEKPWSRSEFVDVCTELAARPGWSLDDLADRLRAVSPSGDFDDDCALVLLTFP